MDRFASFTGWELQALAIGVSDQGDAHARVEQREAIARLLDEIHNEFDIREEMKFVDPGVPREVDAPAESGRLDA